MTESLATYWVRAEEAVSFLRPAERPYWVPIIKTRAKLIVKRRKRGLSIQSFCLFPKIREVDDALTPEAQEWAFEVHPEISFWALSGGQAMTHSKKRSHGHAERTKLLAVEFPSIRDHLADRPKGVAMDDLLDAAAAASTALRHYRGKSERVCPAERDEKGLSVTITY